MSKKTIYIRADGSAEIGLGHLVRCMALGQMLKTDFTIKFVAKEAPDDIIREMEVMGFLLIKIQEEIDFLSILKPKDIVVLDHYGLDSNYQKEIKERKCKLVCIDDLHDRDFFADLIINHAPGVKAEDYKAQIYTQFALGLDYALLRPAFLKAAQQDRKIEKLETVFICFGGSDPLNLTKRCLEILTRLKKFNRIIVVLGAANSNLTSLKRYNEVKGLKFYSSISAEVIVRLMNESDIAIVPASGILLEALSTGCLIISGQYINNQKYLYSQYKHINAFIDAGDFSEENLSGALKKLLSESFSKSKKLIDGYSGIRNHKLVEQLNVEEEICLREANYLDLEITYNWATDQRIRAYSFSQKEIKEDEHNAWFSNKINDDNCIYLVGERKNKAIGSIRFDLKDSIATISYLIDPIFHGQGFGIILLRKGLEALNNTPKVNSYAIIGHVMEGNIPSIRAFEKLGFKKVKEENSLKFIKGI